MNRQFAIYTAQTNCQDCYRCVRSCPVKAIQVKNGHAAIVPKLCVACGTCVDECPSDAKIVRRDFSRVKGLLDRKERVFVSLAPSFVSEFNGFSESQIIDACLKLGFAGVSETAMGADLVSVAVADALAKGEQKLFLSTACPSAVLYIQKYIPELTPYLTEFFSPMLAHARLLKEFYGDDCGVVFIGPCIAKKCESDGHSDLVDVVLTFSEFREWLAAEDIKLEDCAVSGADFVPDKSINGAIYPVVGGMIETLKPCDIKDVQLVTASGLDVIDRTLRGLDEKSLTTPIFVELLACPSGCTGGPCTQKELPALVMDQSVRCHAGEIVPFESDSDLDIGLKYKTDASEIIDEDKDVWSERISNALRQIGKYGRDDELNCGGCGYNSCRDFARAMIEGRAEPDMCVSSLRGRAQKKANALLRCMPSGVVIVDQNLNVVECNRNFAEIAGPDVMLAYDAQPGLEGVDLKRLIPFYELFHHVLRTDEEFHSKLQRIGDRLLNISIFSIEKHQIVGGIALDVTNSEMRREHIVNRAREVIDKNMRTVQDIACKLGEHMADTEILLRSITEDFGDGGRDG